MNAYLQAGKFRKAGFAAKEANEVMPGDARTVLLTGNVWEHIKGGMTDNRHKVIGHQRERDRLAILCRRCDASEFLFFDMFDERNAKVSVDRAFLSFVAQATRYDSAP